MFLACISLPGLFRLPHKFGDNLKVPLAPDKGCELFWWNLDGHSLPVAVAWMKAP